MKQEYLKLLDMIRKAKHTFCLTGAGVSTLSGIPDFRTDKSGVWQRFDRNRIFNIDVFYSEPELFYKFAKEYIYTLHRVKPNVVHLFLAELEKRGLSAGVATQNIDGLHQAAGSRVVYELHGHARTSHCIECGREYSLQETVKRLTNNLYPSCDCGGTIKPDVVFYGEGLPERALMKSLHEAGRCDLFLVLGTSLVVYPAATLPEMALQSGAKVVVMNKTTTPFDQKASLIIRDDLKDVCESLLESI